MSYPQEIRVVRFIIHETGTYNEQYRRPYVSQLTPQGLNQILETAIQSPRINAGIFSGLSNQVVAPSATYESAIQIPGGWGERRMKFMMHLEVRYKTGGTVQEVVTGWSETPAGAVSIYGTLDPNTVFRINNTMIIRQQMMNTPYGNQMQSSITDCSHVLSDDTWSGIRNNNPKQLMMRPIDIFSGIMTSGLQDELNSVGSYDGSITLSNLATKSRRTNTISTNYLSDIIRNYTNASHQLGVGDDGTGNMDILSTAQGYAKEMSSARDPFMETIASMTGGAVTNTFTLTDIERLDPNAPNNTKYIKQSTTDKAMAHQAGQTQHWAGSDLHTHVATILSNAVPSIMMNHLITKIAFVSTNMDITGNLDTRIADLNGFVQNVDMSPHAQAFIAKLENEVLKDIIQNYQIGIGIQMQVDLLGDTWIKLNINNEEIDFVTPSFCDAVLVPVLTQNPQTSQQLAGDFKTLLDNISDYQSNYSPVTGPRDGGLLNYSGIF